MKAIAALAFAALALMGCDQSSPPVVGTWQSPGTVVLKVRENGAALVVEESLNTSPAPYKINAARFTKDNVLEVDRGDYTLKYLYVKSDDSLVANNPFGAPIIFKRVP